MFGVQLNLRVVTSWLLIGALSGVVQLPAAPAVQPGTLATSLPTTSFDITHIAETPRAEQQPDNSSAASGAAAPAKRHISRWVWVAIVAGVGLGAGAGIIAGNKQSAKTAAVPPSATIGVGSGVTAGAP
jgi:hypothetical protein